MNDITKVKPVNKPVAPTEVVAYAPVRERVNNSRAFASGVQAWGELEDQCNAFEAQVQVLTKRNAVLEARNSQLEADNAKLEAAYKHHMAMRIQCATGIKNLLDLANAIAIREQIDLAATADQPKPEIDAATITADDPAPNIDRALAVLAAGD